MRQWRTLPGERCELYSPIGLRPVDEMTGSVPLGRVGVELDIKTENGDWQITGIKPVKTPGGIIAFPGLERRTDAGGQSARAYRIRLNPKFYRPLYPVEADGYEFDTLPYSDVDSPPDIASQLRNAFLTPAQNYPFPGHIRVLHGDVRDMEGRKVKDALVTEGARERVLSDERGGFSLPLRWVPKEIPFSIEARDRENTRMGMISLVIPADLGKSHTIVIS